jgi:hypothetical protein
MSGFESVSKTHTILRGDTTLCVALQADEYKLLNHYLNHPSSYSMEVRWVHQMAFKRDAAKIILIATRYLISSSTGHNS